MDKQKILIVDDEEVNRAILEIMFQTEFDVIQASNGEEAGDGRIWCTGVYAVERSA